MAGVKDIKRRRKSIESTMKITKAMELVAFSKLRKAREQVRQTRPFFNKIYDVITNIAGSNNKINSIFFKKKPVKTRCYVVIAGDKGLAGNYNGNICRFAQSEFDKYNKDDLLLVPIGKKAADFCKKQGYSLYSEYNNISETVDINLALDISKKIIEGFINNKFQEVYIIYTNFISVLVQRPELKKILPLSFSDNETNMKNKNILYDPSPQTVFDKIVPQYITGILYGAIIESFASEQGSRRIAMESANKSAKDMLHDIDIVFNKTRQSKITQEITEIVSGVNIN